MIGLIGAMEEEVRQIAAQMTDRQEKAAAGMTFSTGRIAGKDVTCALSGIGKVNMALCAQILIDRFGADILVNTGVAGSLDPQLCIGDLVIAKDAVYHDMDASVFGDPPGQVPRMNVYAFPCDEALSILAREICERDLPEIHAVRGRVLTGDRAVGDDAEKKRLSLAFGGHCCDMEGAALVHAAYLNGVRALVVRAISDQADHSATMDYETFKEQAIAHTSRLMMEFIREV